MLRLAVIFLLVPSLTWAAPFTLESPDFKPGELIPRKFTCDGENISPTLRWSAPPPGTVKLELVVEDPDAPRGTFTHWRMSNIPPTQTELSGAQSKSASLASGAQQQANDFGRLGYDGPCPPPGNPHRYFFRLKALSASKEVLANSELVGRYRR